MSYLNKKEEDMTDPELIAYNLHQILIQIKALNGVSTFDASLNTYGLFKQAVTNLGVIANKDIPTVSAPKK